MTRQDFFDLLKTDIWSTTISEEKLICRSGYQKEEIFLSSHKEVGCPFTWNELWKWDQWEWMKLLSQQKFDKIQKWFDNDKNNTTLFHVF